MKLPEKSESHRKCCKDFDRFCRHIDYQLKLPIEDENLFQNMFFQLLNNMKQL